MSNAFSSLEDILSMPSLHKVPGWNILCWVQTLHTRNFKHTNPSYGSWPNYFILSRMHCRELENKWSMQVFSTTQRRYCRMPIGIWSPKGDMAASLLQFWLDKTISSHAYCNFEPTRRHGRKPIENSSQPGNIAASLSQFWVRMTMSPQACSSFALAVIFYTM